MIKKILGLGLLCLGFISFCNAGFTSVVGLSSYPSTIDTNYTVDFLKGGGLLTNYLGQGRPFLALRNDVLVWWYPNGFPYVYMRAHSQNDVRQGFFQTYFSCDEITGNITSMPTNCTQGDIIDYTGDTQLIRDLFKGFFSKVVAGDYAYYDYGDYRYVGATWSYFYNGIKICWSSHEIGKSLCFVGGHDSRGSYLSYFDFYGLPLVNSLEFENLTFGRVSDSNIGRAPGQAGYGGGGNIEGGSSTSVNVNLTGDLVYNSCTNAYILNRIDDLWGRKSFRLYCHAGTYDTGSIIGDYTGSMSYIPGIGVDYKYVYSNTKNGLSWNHWFESNLDSMARYKEGNFGNTNPFMSQPLYLYTYFENLYNNGVQGIISSYDVLNYCNIMLYSDLTAEYKGEYFKSYCDDLNVDNGGGTMTTGEIGTIEDEEILPPGFDNGGNNNVGSSGTVVSVDWSGVLSGDTNKNYDGKNFINDYYQMLKANYQKPYNGIVGIIPNYILVFMLALILFRFISH